MFGNLVGVVWVGWLLCGVPAYVLRLLVWFWVFWDRDCASRTSVRVGWVWDILTGVPVLLGGLQFPAGGLWLIALWVAGYDGSDLFVWF